MLDHPAPNKTKDQTDEETREALDEGLGNSLSFAWALERADPMAASWIYSNAYHIKVAVRDGKSFWLSSGNFNNSNQPDIDPVADPAGSSAIARKSDRDWHVIVEHQRLAGIFEAFLQNDLSVAQQHQTTAAGQAAIVAALGELAEPPLTIAARTAKQYFVQRTDGRLRRQPFDRFLMGVA